MSYEIWLHLCPITLHVEQRYWRDRPSGELPQRRHLVSIGFVVKDDGETSEWWESVLLGVEDFRQVCMYPRVFTCGI